MVSGEILSSEMSYKSKSYLIIYYFLAKLVKNMIDMYHGYSEKKWQEILNIKNRIKIFNHVLNLDQPYYDVTKLCEINRFNKCGKD